MKDRPAVIRLARDEAELLLRAACRALRFLELREEGEHIRERAFACLDQTTWERLMAWVGIRWVPKRLVGAEQSMHELWAHRQATVSDIKARMRRLESGIGSPYRAAGAGQVKLTDSEYGRLNLWVMQAAAWQNRVGRVFPCTVGAHDPVQLRRHMPSLWPYVVEFWRRFSAS